MEENGSEGRLDTQILGVGVKEGNKRGLPCVQLSRWVDDDPII